MHTNNTPLLVALVLLGLLAVTTFVLRLLARRRRSQNVSAAYEAAPALLTSAERSFFGVLEQALSCDYRILAKVRLADIVRPARNPGRSGWQSAFNRIAGKHVDFVLCRPTDLGVVAVIELDDRSHARLEHGVRDCLVDSALADAHIPILRRSARQSYSPAQIREQVENLLRSRARAESEIT